jgi:hypothetical protein
MPFLDLLVCFFGNGMIASMLEPHLAEAGADPTQVGLTFLIFGAVFMVSTPLAGFVRIFILHHFEYVKNRRCPKSQQVQSVECRT